MGKKSTDKTCQSKEAISRKKGISKEAVSRKKGISKEAIGKNVSREAVKTAHSARSATTTETTHNKDTIDNDESVFNFMARALSHNHWFHGSMPRDEIEDLLKDEGDFLLRRTEVEKKPRFAISVMRKGAIKHILLSWKDGLWCIRDVSLIIQLLYPSIYEQSN